MITTRHRGTRATIELRRGPSAGAGGRQPTVTSHEDDAPVSEPGELAAKFWAFREVIAGYTLLPEVHRRVRARPGSSPARSR